MNKLKIILSLFILFLIPLSGEAAPKRIVSLTPAGTEILYAFGQEKNLIANTTFCDYPLAATQKPKVGGFASMNFEYLISHRADLVVIQDLHAQFIPQLKKLKIPYVMIRQNSIQEICDSITSIGEVCNSEKKALDIVSDIQKDIKYVENKLIKSVRPRILLCISREFTGKKVNSFFAAGNASFYNDIISRAGGINALKEQKVAYPQISQEGLLMINPDVILELMGDVDSGHSLRKGFHGVSKEAIKKQWMNGVRVKAVEEEQIYILQGSIYLRPGPRVGRVLKAFAAAMHPEIKW